jgi:high-affinity Fe2+/Pb2+ permease
MMFSDNFFKKVENKTNVDKNTIMDLASKLQKNNLKDEATLREVIHNLSQMVGKGVSKEQEDKIISTIVNDKVPKDLDKFVDKNL